MEYLELIARPFVVTATLLAWSPFLLALLVFATFDGSLDRDDVPSIFRMYLRPLWEDTPLHLAAPVLLLLHLCGAAIIF